jgi:pimeloyl-ACP methyl ester carboxylesterase
MAKPKSKKMKLPAVVLSLVFLFSPFSFGGYWEGKIKAGEPEVVFPTDPENIIEISGGMQVWSKNDNIEIDRTVVVKRGTMLMIEPGAVIKFTKRENELAPLLFVEKGGFLLAEGTETEKIVFTSDQENSYFSIIIEGENVSDANAAFLRYVEISKAGGEYEYDKPYQAFNFFGFNKVLADNVAGPAIDYRFPIRHLGGAMTIENCRFHNNKSVDIYISNQVINPENLAESDGRLVTISNSNFEDNRSGIAIASDCHCDGQTEECSKALVLANNWYGKNTGPFIIKWNYNYFLEHKDDFAIDDLWGAKVICRYSEVPNYRTKSLIADPVVIIPGIMGSEKEMIGNDLVLDPILHTYEDLVESLEKNGYEKDKNLFEFPYQWRNSNVVSAQDLASRLSQIQSEIFNSRFDIVAHSMGGLVARKYIQGSNYAWNIDQLVTMGTPHRGSPESYLQWEAGEGFFGPFGFLLSYHFLQEAQHKDYDDLFSYIQNEVLSVRELLPVYDYLYDVEDQQMRSYPENYPRNYFIEDLELSGLDNLDYVRKINIVGKEDKENTISKIKVTEDNDGEKWEYGKPENFDEEKLQGLNFGEGDETVPLESARAENIIPAEDTIEIQSNHQELPTQVQCEVFSRLTGVGVCSFQDEWDIANVLYFNVFSPVDIQITDPDNLKLGKNFATGEPINEIAGAYYSGFDTENEFAVIPNPKKGKYKILTEGTGTGNYKVEVSSVAEESESPQGVFESKVVFEGQANSDQMEERELEVLDDKRIEEIQVDQTPPQVEIISPKNGEKYLNNQAVGVDYEINDDVSATENVEKTVKLDGENFAESEIELWLMKVGEHKLKIEAQDEAGNVSEKESLFRSEASFRSVIDNVGRYYESGLITSRKEKDFLIQTLKKMQTIDNFRRWLTDHQIFFRQKRALDRILRNLDRAMEREIKFLIKRIENKEGKTVASQAADLLTDSLEYIRLK